MVRTTVEMLAAARRKGRIAYVLEPGFGSVQAELDAGNPVLVLQDLGALGIRRWHFAVVIGHDPGRDVVILRSGTRRRHILRRSDFLRTWQAGGDWAAVVTPALVERVSGSKMPAVTSLKLPARLGDVGRLNRP